MYTELNFIKTSTLFMLKFRLYEKVIFRMNYRRFIFLFWGVIFLEWLQAQTNFIPLSVDHAVYGGHPGKVYVELYLSFPQKSLTYRLEESFYQGEYVALAEIYRGDSLIANQVKQRLSRVESAEEVASNRQFVNVFGFEIPPGDYRSNIVVRDLNSLRSGEYTLTFHTTRFDSANLQMSEIQLANRISRAGEENEFYKNTFQVIPNPEGRFHVKQPVLFYYAELYHLQFDPENPGEYRIKCFILNSEGDTVKNYPIGSYKKPGDTAVLVGGHNIITLPGGDYRLILQAEDRQNRQMATRVKEFSVIKPVQPLVAKEESGADLTPAEEAAYYATLDESRLDTEFQWVTYIATKQEKEVYPSLKVEGKRQFLIEFWKKRDDSPRTPLNEFKQNYLQRVQYANQNFGTMRKQGWETDRGRILLTYGAPDEIERHTMVIDKKPYEIWYHHNLEGGVIFIFADLYGLGDFELIHSTFSRELSQPHWERLIQRTPGSSSSYDQGP
ncbi:MAG: hypothetical protein Kow0042_14270 [Calditrichia bacterium]